MRRSRGFLGVADAHEIVFTRNATEAINLVAYSWGRKHIGRGDVIVLTEMEHHANLVPWQLLAQEKDADLEFIPITDDGILRQDVFDVLLKLKPKLVAFTHVSNTLGTINPIEDMTRRAHEAGALVLIDGAQAVPHVPVDVAAIGCDFYAFSGHKMLAPTGSGALWGRRALLEAMPPFLAGGEMIREVHLRRSEFNYDPVEVRGRHAGHLGRRGPRGRRRLPDATWAWPTSASTSASSSSTRSRCCRARSLDRAVRADGPRPARRRRAVQPPGRPPARRGAGARPVRRRVRAGHHCTMPLHERLDLAATARASFGVYTTKGDIDALAAGLQQVVKLFGVEG